MRYGIQTAIVATLTGALLAGCQSMGGPDLGPPSKALAPAELPVTVVGSKHDFLVNGSREVTVELVESSDGYESWERSDGVSWKTANLFAPAIEYSLPDDAGEQTVVGNMNDLFPLEVGKSVTVDYQGQSTKFPDGWTGSRRCTVAAERSLTVAAGTFDTYEVVCIQGDDLNRPWRTRTFYYAPEVQLVVYERRQTRRQRDRVQELLRL